MTLPATSGGQIVRPLSVLIPLIKKDLNDGNLAAEEAAKPFYQAAGEKMLEAKGQMAHGEFTAWVERHFKIGIRHAQTYMKFALAISDDQKRGETRFSTLRDAERASGNQNYGRAASWQQPIKEALDRVDVEAARQGLLARAEERETQRKLALQLIDIGYKALATKLHPDKGGSRDAMSRLNAVRDRLKKAV